MLVFRRDLVNGLRNVSKYVCDRGNNKPYLPEVVGAEERLQQGVHIARGALVFQSDVARFLLRIVAGRSDLRP